MENNLISSAFRKKIGSIQTNVEQQLQPENDGTINKILGVNAKSYVESIEMLNGEANYTLEVIFNVMYLDENNETLMMMKKCEVAGKYEDNSLNTLMQPVSKVEVVDVSIDSASSNEVRVQSTLELSLDVIDNIEIEPFSPTDENVLIKTEPKKFLTLQDVGKSNFTVTDEFDLKQNINKVLLTNTTVCVKDVSAGTGYFTIEGDICFKAYLEMLDNETKSYKLLNETIPFKEEIDAEKVTKDGIIKVLPYIKYDDLSFKITGNNDINNLLEVSVPVVVRYISLIETEQQIAEDSYSLTHKLNIVTDTYYVGNMLSSSNKEHIDGNIEISEDLSRINRVLLSGNENVNITNSFVNENSVQVEGVLTTSVIYEADDENSTQNSVQMEIPFAVNLNIDNLHSDDEVFVTCEVTECSVKAKRGKDLELDAEVNFVVDSFNKQPETFIKDVVLTEELLNSPYSLQLYLAPQGATLWDISKHLNVKEETILEQNEGLVFPLEKTESIVYFSNK